MEYWSVGPKTKKKCFEISKSLKDEIFEAVKNRVFPITPSLQYSRERMKCSQTPRWGEIKANPLSVDSLELGCRQAVRHGLLEPAFGGSNPPTPAKGEKSETI